MKFRVACLSLLALCRCTYAAAQTANSIVPSIVRFSSSASDVNAKPLHGATALTFRLYQQQQGGSPLWSETQNVQLDIDGRYTVLLGSSTASGFPVNLFERSQAGWLGVQAQGEQEQPRVQLIAVPYALKAADASMSGNPSPTASVQSINTEASAEPPIADVEPVYYFHFGHHRRGDPPVTTNGGTANFVPLWTDSTILGNSTLFQLGNSIGIGTTTPGVTLDVNGKARIAGGLDLSGIGSWVGVNRNVSNGADLQSKLRCISTGPERCRPVVPNTAVRPERFQHGSPLLRGAQRQRYVGCRQRRHGRHWDAVSHCCARCRWQDQD